MSAFVFENASVLDVVTGSILADHHVLVIDSTIMEVSPSPIAFHDATRIDACGRSLMPGLCDAHVHVTATTPDFAALGRWAPIETCLIE